MSKPFLHWAQMKTRNPNDQQHVNMLLCSNANVWASLHPKISRHFRDQASNGWPYRAVSDWPDLVLAGEEWKTAN